MLTSETFRQLALAMPEAVEADHWDNPSFRVRKRIFATLRPAEGFGVLKLDAVWQGVFVATGMCEPVPGGWGRQGYTRVLLDKVDEPTLLHGLQTAWCLTAPKTLRNGAGFCDAGDAGITE